MSLSDEDLVAALRAKSAGAWEALIDRYGRLAWSVPLRMGLSDVDAEEVCQATWVILHRHLTWIERPGSIAAWILTTAGREAVKLKRLRARHRSLDVELEEPPDAAILPREELDRLESLQRVRELVDALPKPCRRLMTMLYFDPQEPSYLEIGRALRIPVGSIGPMRGRCLARLARQLQASELHPAGEARPATARSRPVAARAKEGRV